jgi:predicted nucleic-acid-binding protein
MIGIDTNVLIRYITQDDQVQSPKATAFMERRLSPSHPGYVSVIAVVEAVWVLSSAYRFSDRQIAGVLEAMLGAESLVVEDAQDVSIALVALRRKMGGFADVLLGAKCRRAGCAHTVTFDKKASRLPGFASVS